MSYIRCNYPTPEALLNLGRCTYMLKYFEEKFHPKLVYVENEIQIFFADPPTRGKVPSSLFWQKMQRGEKCKRLLLVMWADCFRKMICFDRNEEVLGTSIATLIQNSVSEKPTRSKSKFLSILSGMGLRN